MENFSRELVGLIPAAGLAMRMGRTPGSKELFPIAFERDAAGVPRPRVACEYLLGALREAGVRTAHMVLRAGKWDIPAYLRDGRDFGLDLSYLVMRHPYGVPFTVDQAYPFVRDATVALGFPDVIFEPRRAFTLALERLQRRGADAVLGLFPARDPSGCDMVGVDEDGELLRLDIKPRQTDLDLTWGLCVWTPRFTAFLHEHVQELLAEGAAARADRELHLGDVLRSASGSGLRIEGIQVSDRPFLDVGTPEALEEAVRFHASRRE